MADFWFSLGTPVSSTNTTDRHYIAEILLKVALNTITLIFLASQSFVFERITEARRAYQNVKLGIAVTVCPPSLTMLQSSSPKALSQLKTYIVAMLI